MHWRVDFDHGMRFSSAYRQPLRPEQWALIKARYQQFLARPSEKKAIPKILHQIWLGSELPEQYRGLIEKLRELHPHWEYKLWTDRNIDFPLQNRRLFDRCTNMGQKSDILRYEILHRFGGVYLDLDFLAIRPFDALLHADFFAGITYNREPQLANGLIGCVPELPLLQILCRLEDQSPVTEQMSIMHTTGPDYLTTTVFSHWRQSCGVFLPNTHFYPFPNFPHDRTRGPELASYLGEESFCCHLWHCSWLKKDKKPLGLLTKLKKLINA